MVYMIYIYAYLDKFDDDLKLRPNPGMMVRIRGNYPKISLFQISELQYHVLPNYIKYKTNLDMCIYIYIKIRLTTSD